MNCPICGCETSVVDSRPSEDSVKRRRQCVECKHRFTTVEIDADYYAILMPTDKKAFQEALFFGCAELTRRLYRVLNIEERKESNETESCS